MRRSRLVFGALVFLLVASACDAFTTPDPEPGLEVIGTDLQFKTIAEEGAGPPNVAPQPPVPTFRPFPTLAPTTPRPDLCPTAAPTEQPDEDVPDTVTRTPRSGRYLWKIDGSERIEQIRASFPPYADRFVQNVQGEVASQRLEMTDFTFETVETELGSQSGRAQVVQTFHVTDSGVFLQKIEKTFPGGETTTFEPVEEVLYLQMPVVIGPDDSWSTTAVDLFSEGQPQILTHDAFVRGRTTLDVCGERIRVWIIESTQTFQVGDSTVTRSYDYGIATHFGGIITFEQVLTPCDDLNTDGVCDNDPDVAYEAQIGRLIPEEVPE